MSTRRYPGWAVYLAGFGALVFLVSLLALALVPSSDPVSLLEQALWGALVVAFFALLPLFFMRLKAMVLRLAASQPDEHAPPPRHRPDSIGDQARRGRDENG
ncbi:hypothetical protein IC757_16355 [Wenzhouxiangella sp. AB-CW3]|uniref:hypothetical protein n=1 Tax=Wenzhouxiangella sp. AB-CW3 TaxID=2771012 RepID=UPI00168A9B70|nr:hypothetical protein [Wenzhouxiangella sp. AB-CW3]QOC22554.1 hypothetical protein IC757_16355 [Wenzhouxiangella sp. AB-CW3]